LLYQFVLQTAFSQNVGIGTTTPQSKLDINGDIAVRSADLTIGTTYTYALNVNTVKQSNYKLKPAAVPVGNFVLAGIAAGVEGRLITLTNRTLNSMEIYNEDVNATASNRIQTGTGNTVAIYPNGNVTLQYDATDQRWSVKSMHNNSLDYFGGGGGGTSYWDIAGLNIYNSNTGNVGIGVSNPSRAKLEVNGVSGSGYTSAIIGGDGSGISFQRSWPTIGFNQYRDEPTGWGKAIATGYGMHMYLDPALGNFAIDMQDSVAANTAFAIAPKRSMTIFKNGYLHIGNNNVSDLASLSISGSNNFPSHFNFGSDGHTYIRGGNRLRTPGQFGFRPSKVYINDIDGVSLTNPPISYPGGDVIIATGGGNVGIGIDNDVPSKLSIYQPTIASNGNTSVLQLRGKNPLQAFVDEFNTSRGYIKGITDRTQTNQFSREGIEIGTGGGDIYLTALGYQPALMVNGTTNNVGIGTNNPTEKLSVNGHIRAKEIVVETGWADYVFDKQYTLPPLSEVEDFIKKNKHLPNIPSAASIQKDGLKVGEVQTKMMEKIEELTLYVIELKKEMELLKLKDIKK